MGWLEVVERAERGRLGTLEEGGSGSGGEEENEDDEEEEGDDDLWEKVEVRAQWYQQGEHGIGKEQQGPHRQQQGQQQGLQGQQQGQQGQQKQGAREGQGGGQQQDSMWEGRPRGGIMFVGSSGSSGASRSRSLQDSTCQDSSTYHAPHTFPPLPPTSSTLLPQSSLSAAAAAAPPGPNSPVPLAMPAPRYATAAAAGGASVQEVRGFAEGGESAIARIENREVVVVEERAWGGTGGDGREPEGRGRGWGGGREEEVDGQAKTWGGGELNDWGANASDSESSVVEAVAVGPRTVPAAAAAATAVAGGGGGAGVRLGGWSGDVDAFSGKSGGAGAGRGAGRGAGGGGGGGGGGSGGGVAAGERVQVWSSFDPNASAAFSSANTSPYHQNKHHFPHHHQHHQHHQQHQQQHQHPQQVLNIPRAAASLESPCHSQHQYPALPQYYSPIDSPYQHPSRFSRRQQHHSPSRSPLLYFASVLRQHAQASSSSLDSVIITASGDCQVPAAFPHKHASPQGFMLPVSAAAAASAASSAAAAAVAAAAAAAAPAGDGLVNNRAVPLEDQGKAGSRSSSKKNQGGEAKCEEEMMRNKQAKEGSADLSPEATSSGKITSFKLWGLKRGVAGAAADKGKAKARDKRKHKGRSKVEEERQGPVQVNESGMAVGERGSEKGSPWIKGQEGRVSKGSSLWYGRGRSRVVERREERDESLDRKQGISERERGDKPWHELRQECETRLLEVTATAATAAAVASAVAAAAEEDEVTSTESWPAPSQQQQRQQKRQHKLLPLELMGVTVGSGGGYGQGREEETGKGRREVVWLKQEIGWGGRRGGRRGGERDGGSELATRGRRDEGGSEEEWSSEEEDEEEEEEEWSEGEKEEVEDDEMGERGEEEWKQEEEGDSRSEGEGEEEDDDEEEGQSENATEDCDEHSSPMEDAWEPIRLERLPGPPPSFVASAARVYRPPTPPVLRVRHLGKQAAYRADLREHLEDLYSDDLPCHPQQQQQDHHQQNHHHQPELYRDPHGQPQQWQRPQQGAAANSTPLGSRTAPPLPLPPASAIQRFPPHHLIRPQPLALPPFHSNQTEPLPLPALSASGYYPGSSSLDSAAAVLPSPGHFGPSSCPASLPPSQWPPSHYAAAAAAAAAAAGLPIYVTPRRDNRDMETAWVDQDTTQPYFHSAQERRALAAGHASLEDSSAEGMALYGGYAAYEGRQI
ncbi:hypothetical protein CLOP_g23209 [Closterium sp. NIES-67]|nr:hypothetical protein CLOP_g23209 [Closterium sp. NIES-67]